MTQAITTALESITAAGLRLTMARRAIITSLASLAQPVTTLELANMTKVDTATVYRNIGPLLAAGVLEEITVAGGISRFALTHGHHHDHLVCTACGLIVHVSCTLKATPAITHSQFAKIDHHAVTYYGLCKHCSPFF